MCNELCQKIDPNVLRSLTFIRFSSSQPISTEQLSKARKHTRRIARSHYENFLVGSALLPRHMRQAFFDLYAFCRTADDWADESASPDQAVSGLEDYRRRIAGLFTTPIDAPLASGLGQRGELAKPPDSQEVSWLFTALADTVSRFQLPRQPFDDLLDAFMQDQTVRRYRDEVELQEYCRRSANPVGRLILAMAGCDSAENVRLSDEICSALQLANFWQDMARDYAADRIYLPGSVMRKHGFDESRIAATIQQRRKTPACIRAALAQECERARAGFERGRAIVHHVPRWLAADLELFLRGGFGTLDAIERIDFDVLRHRPVVSKTQQAYWLTHTWLRTIFNRSRRRGGGT